MIRRVSLDSEPAIMFSSDTGPDLEDELRQLQPLPAPVSPVSTVQSLRQVESLSSYPTLAVPIVSSTVTLVQSPGTMDTFPTYAGLSGPDLPTSGRSSDAPGYLPMTLPVTPQCPEGPLSLLGLGTPTLGERGSLDSLLAYDISILNSAADLTQLALPLVPLSGDLQLLAKAALGQLPVLTHPSPQPGPSATIVPPTPDRSQEGPFDPYSAPADTGGGGGGWICQPVVGGGAFS